MKKCVQIEFWDIQENEDYKTILIKRYIEGYKWDDIASLIYVSKSTVKRWHEEALVSLNIH